MDNYQQGMINDTLQLNMKVYLPWLSWKDPWYEQNQHQLKLQQIQIQPFGKMELQLHLL